MKRSGRFNPFIVVGVICLILLVPLLFISKRGPENACADFMTALGKGDTTKLADVTVIGNKTVEERKQLWEQTMADAKHYLFTWRVTDVSPIDDNHAAVILMVRQNLQIRMGEDEKLFQVPMVKVDNNWKVAVDQLNREIFPFLPRQ